MQISLLRINNGEPVDVGTIAGTVEEVEGKVWTFLYSYFALKHTLGCEMLS